jgi:hypothetical protein
MRNLVLGAVLALASISGCAKDKTEPAAKAEENFPSMTVAEVDQAITAKQATAVDCNGERTRKKMGVLPGAVVVTDEETYAASELPADKTTKLVFYCADPG